MKTALLLVTDAKGFELTLHAVAVALITQSTTRNIIVQCVDFSPSPPASLLEAAKDKGFTIEFRHLASDDIHKTSSISRGDHSHLTYASLMKMVAMDRLRGEFDVVLYTDFDILLMEDIDIAKFDFEGMPIAAVYDFAAAKWHDESDLFYERCKSNEKSPKYFNSGFIAANFANWNADFSALFNDKVLKHLEYCNYQDGCTRNDQCSWNETFERNWKVLPATYNFQACAMFTDRWSRARVRHYVGKKKYLPVKSWRNDERDLKLLSGARAILGREPLKTLPLLKVIRALNQLRNIKSSNDMDRRIDKLEKSLAAG